VGSIPTRSRHVSRAPSRLVARIAFVALLAPIATVAQRPDSARVGVPRPTGDSAAVARASQQAVQAPRDSLSPPISGRRAFLYSLMLPGWGQTRLDRPSAAAIYSGFEMAAIWMLMKTTAKLRQAERGVKLNIINTYVVDESGRPVFDENGAPVPEDTLINPYAPEDPESNRSLLRARKLQYEDWVTLLIFNHLFSAADAFVAAQLWDLPKRVEFRTLPGNAKALVLRFSFR
jgi:hypothetical protein